MIRIALGVEYIGTRYHGWQRQDDGPALTVQAELEQAISFVANHPVSVICAGRTDAGVHAVGQVVHFDSAADRSEHAWLLGINTRLPADISVRWLRAMPPDFHARHAALRRHYRYLIWNNMLRSPVWHQRTTFVYKPLDHTQMHQAAQLLLGEHDFSAFRSPECQARSPVRTLQHIDIQRNGDLIQLDLCANAFLHHMVRNIVGVLLPIGRGLQPVAWAQQVLEGRARRLAGITAAPHGLYLRQVDYPQHYAIPFMETFA